MTNQLLIFLQAANPPAPDSSGLWLYMGLFAIAMYFFMIRPQQKRAKAAKEFVQGLEKGQDVITAGGIHGKISSVQDTSVVISTDAGKLKVEKSAVSATFTPAR